MTLLLRWSAGRDTSSRHSLPISCDKVIWQINLETVNAWQHRQDRNTLLTHTFILKLNTKAGQGKNRKAVLL